MTDRYPRPGVGVVVVEDGRILLVQRGRDPGKGMWAVPGGRQHFGEPLRDAARREAREETGLDVVIGDVVWVGDSIGPGDPPAWHFAIIDFLAHPIAGELRAADDADDVRWVDADEARSLPLVPTMPSLLDVVFARHE
jgi:ADP-ribose pyrophosphatase YjhB (NUDIX family)